MDLLIDKSNLEATPSEQINLKVDNTQPLKKTTRSKKSKKLKETEEKIQMDIQEKMESAVSTKSTRRIKADFATKYRMNTFICVVENPQLTINVGAIVRTANALGIAKVYVIDGNNIMKKSWEAMRKDKHLNTITVSAIKWTYIKVFETTTQCVEHLKKHNFTSVVTSPHDKGGNPSVELKSGKFTDKKIAVWFGNESVGISNEAIEACNRCVKINMYGMIESMNLASCAAIVMYEIANQRRSFNNKHVTTLTNDTVSTKEMTMV